MKEFKTAINNIYGFKVGESESGEPVVKPPVMDLPQTVKERIDYFGRMMEDGMTLMGAMRFILCYEEGEEKIKLIEDYQFGAVEEWLDPTDEFIEWRDSLMRMSEMVIAAALLYGMGKEEGADE